MRPTARLAALLFVMLLACAAWAALPGCGNSAENNADPGGTSGGASDAASSDGTADAASTDDDGGDAGPVPTGTAWVRFATTTLATRDTASPDGGAPGTVPFRVALQGAAGFLFDGVPTLVDDEPPPSAPGATTYAQVPAGVPIVLTVTDARAGFDTGTVALISPSVLDAGEYYTLAAVGRYERFYDYSSVDAGVLTGNTRPSLLLVHEAFTAPPASSVALRFVAGGGAPGFFYTLQTDDGAVVALAPSNDASPADGSVAPANVDHLLVTTSAEDQLGKRGFTVPSGIFEAGGTYLLIGDLYNPHELLVLPGHSAAASTAKAAWLLEDPVVELLHVVRGAPALVDAYAGTQRIARSVRFAAGALAIDGTDTGLLAQAAVRATTTGAALRFAAQDTGATLLTATTGPLVAGQRYIGLLGGQVGSAAAPPSLQVVAIPPTGRARFLHASPATGAVDFGAFNIGDARTGAIGTVFTPAVTGVTYGGAASDVPFTPPINALSYGYVGVRAGATLYRAQALPDGRIFVFFAGPTGAPELYERGGGAYPVTSPSCGGNFFPLPCLP